MTTHFRGAPWLALVLCALDGAAPGQEQPRPEVANGGMEHGEVGQAPTGWSFTSGCGATAVIDADDPFVGRQSAVIDASTPTGTGQRFSNLMQALDAQSWQGKRVRFRAAVKVAELAPGATVQLWFRVDRRAKDGGEMQTGAFDNMGDRPIRTETWAHHDIVLDVDADAERIACGMFVSGTGKAWLDDVSLEIAGAGVATTGGAAAASARSSMPPVLRKAFAEAENAPHQPFFTAWLWLPAFALFVFVLALWPTVRGNEPGVEGAQGAGPIRSFAIRFTVAYWLLYNLPGPFSQLIPWLGPQLETAHQWIDQQLVSLTARVGFGIEGDLVPPNGSGDTTLNYISLLSGFVLALAIATIWSVFSRRRPDYAVMLDLLRSYLRYVLAFSMLGYGLAKVTMGQNQFPVIGDWQLQKTWGDCSPMNVVWSF
ncbi:MAG: hypothetical protein ABIP94_17595, partial [Planctomycetota bacterium]